MPRQAASLAMLMMAAILSACIGVGAPYPQGAHQNLVPGSQSKQLDYQGHTLAWVQTGQVDAPPVLFVHGTPGTWEAFSGYMKRPELAERFDLISVDRPGFGASAGGGLLPKLADQARVIAQALQGRPPAIVVGHSLGGPIAVQLAADFPERVKALVLVAGSFDPALETPRWYNRLADSWPLRFAVPKPMRAANDEVLVLERELESLRSRWQDVAAPVTIIQGGKDRLVYPANADFAERMLGDAQTTMVRLPDAGHFILWEQPELIVQAILAAAS